MLQKYAAYQKSDIFMATDVMLYISKEKFCEREESKVIYVVPDVEHSRNP